MARIDEPERSAETARLVARRYGLLGRFMLRKSDPDRVGITIWTDGQTGERDAPLPN